MVEDSPTGVAAARAAGLRVLAVPSALTRSLDYSAATLVLAGLADVPDALTGLGETPDALTGLRHGRGGYLRVRH